MADYPALPLWTDAYLGDTHPELTLEEHGAYMLLLMAAWRRPDCALPDDDRFFTRFLGIHGNKWRKIKPAVLERFFALEDGFWIQKRLRKERDFVEKFKRNQKEKAEKRWAKERENKGLEDAGGYAPTPTPTPKEKENYAFFGKVIRLTPTDFAKWEQSYSHIPDLRAELQSLDDWWTQKPKDEQRNWFHRTSAALKNRNQEHAQAAKEERHPRAGESVI